MAPITHGSHGRALCPHGCGKTVSIRRDSGEATRHRCPGPKPPKMVSERMLDWICRDHGYAFNSKKATPCPKGGCTRIQSYFDYYAKGAAAPEPCSIAVKGNAFECTLHNVRGRFLKVPPQVCPRPAPPPQYRTAWRL